MEPAAPSDLSFPRHRRVGCPVSSRRPQAGWADPPRAPRSGMEGPFTGRQPSSEESAGRTTRPEAAGNASGPRRWWGASKSPASAAVPGAAPASRPARGELQLPEGRGGASRSACARVAGGRGAAPPPRRTTRRCDWLRRVTSGGLRLAALKKGALSGRGGWEEEEYGGGERRDRTGDDGG